MRLTDIEYKPKFVKKEVIEKKLYGPHSYSSEETIDGYARNIYHCDKCGKYSWWKFIQTKRNKDQIVQCGTCKDQSIVKYDPY